MKLTEDRYKELVDLAVRCTAVTGDRDLRAVIVTVVLTDMLKREAEED